MLRDQRQAFSVDGHRAAPDQGVSVIAAIRVIAAGVLGR